LGPGFANIEDSTALLPSGTSCIPIEGGNHVQFGWLGPQSGDHRAVDSHAEQQSQIVSATVAQPERLQPGALYP